MESLAKLSIRTIHEKLVHREISAVEIARMHLEHIENTDQEFHAFLTVTADMALEQAALVDEKIKEGQEIPLLAGIPCAVKDAILVKGVRCTAGSKILENYIAPYDATVIARLREQGTVLVGKTNTDEFGMGTSTENSAFGATKNPHDLTRVAGGSSGGSAAAVCSGESVFALGEDTGGSIRLPASFCGVIGLKPTYGTVSRHGIIALASSLDQVGPFARNVEDAQTVFDAISGKDPLDSTSVLYRYAPLQEDINPKKIRIGVPKEFFAEGLDSQVEKVIRDMLAILEKGGAEIHEISLPNAPYALAVYYIINTSEASANLARYDAIRYGVPAQPKEAATDEKLFHVYMNNRGEKFGPEVKRRIMLGTYALSAGYYDAYYVKAQKIRTLLKQDFDRAFEKVDVIMGPTTPFLPFKLNERTADPLSMYLADLFTVPVNLAGLPALSVPAGKVGELPVGMHIIARAFGEPLLFQAGKLIENAWNF
ncbi:MAG: glutaminyl-tRNA synthase (glutamine-hydrolyzing) subunit A [Candidatus Wildermuthbacteria bacterium RIFCSPHIGHO2_12_FULL_45_9]|uniref:Glutamyl-tRNA(Gln) amidotransferase subunit A n=1 Tax=Candidatus Wildermuthbacteria bacterium RIFCSPHIGHO2_02_FULL_45_25 TaxID=1802450 RepID=A0A1G2QXN0_9BACT|nr:MAG: glutaminyl-tRNA synthase (glutamine-hydrolyzing) subunit A [Candidatus Wildermuthbacteria bacterium RIFCSPHIGHO2_01_FULL_45_20]OHA65263.1 MAG: glutaminyl-tRNA synthase (glutamine-hydrolyzing) subunit A [Candidatus Wildermuthbacteria bacterium RIFCSPHIGHO2_02_FULL_45_25]OHA71452.1 MAG: glutaminyl-tRNA synthase (glutamine-hydrolyzing) subunit A [Candidatus Wildermuthbacteria bacterium RIFCSPHIGHO2_12_FULL_45_9]